MIENYLGAETNPEKRFARRSPVAQKGVETLFFEFRHGKGRLSYTGEYEPVHAGKFRRVCGCGEGCAYFIQSQFNAADVSGVIVNYACHYPILPVRDLLVNRDIQEAEKNADTRDTMSLGELFSLLQKILTTREVIVVTIVIALYVNLVMYVVRYRKQSFRAKKPWRRVAKSKEEPILVEENDEEGREEPEDGEE